MKNFVGKSKQHPQDLLDQNFPQTFKNHVGVKYGKLESWNRSYTRAKTILERLDGVQMNVDFEIAALFPSPFS